MKLTRLIALTVPLAVGCAFAVPGAASAGLLAQWQPGPDTTWQVQLSGRIDTSVAADAFDIDYETPQSVVDALHAKGSKVVCYLSAGSWEDYRPDADQFPESVLGKKLDGWPHERWLDIRQIDVLAPIMEARLDICVDKGFDAADFDNVDGYQNRTGFKLTGADQLAYNRYLAQAAHDRGLAAGLKNDLGQVTALEPSFEFAVNEECADYRECQRLTPFTDARKAIVMLEYKKPLSGFCDDAAKLSAYGMKKKLSLNAWRQPCP